MHSHTPHDSGPPNSSTNSSRKWGQRLNIWSHVGMPWRLDTAGCDGAAVKPQLKHRRWSPAEAASAYDRTLQPACPKLQGLNGATCCSECPNTASLSSCGFALAHSMNPKNHRCHLCRNGKVLGKDSARPKLYTSIHYPDDVSPRL